VKEGFSGKIFCTPATKDLTAILLDDSANIQRDDTEYVNKRRLKQGLPPFEPLYDMNDVHNALPLFTIINYGEWFKIENGIEVLYTDAGHIIGSAAVHLKITENGKTQQISFSGDVGRYLDVILCSPQIFPQADYIILESTYGNKLHEEIFNSADHLLQWIDKTCIQKKGKLIIPAFSVGRTQELLYFLNQLSNEKRLPAIPVYVDSPLSQEATDVVKSHPKNFNESIKNLLLTDNDPFNFKGLKFIKSADESKQLNNLLQPCIIISASGMADAGRIKHHIKNNIHDVKNTILIVGYCEPNSLGGRLTAGQKEVRIFGEYYKVMAEVGVMLNMSAHGDYNDLCRFIASQNAEAIKKLFLVHGEYNVQLAFRQRLLQNNCKNVEVPDMHQEYLL
jgi:metallo-beta-lactamase family protein